MPANTGGAKFLSVQFESNSSLDAPKFENVQIAFEVNFHLEAFKF